MIACLSEYIPWYSFAEVRSVSAHRVEPVEERRHEAAMTARLLREALLLKLSEIEAQIEICRHRVETIEGRFGLSQDELDSALARHSLAISQDEAETWHSELELLDSLARDRRHLQAILG